MGLKVTEVRYSNPLFVSADQVLEEPYAKYVSHDVAEVQAIVYRDNAWWFRQVSLWKRVSRWEAVLSPFHVLPRLPGWDMCPFPFPPCFPHHYGAPSLLLNEIDCENLPAFNPHDVSCLLRRLVHVRASSGAIRTYQGVLDRTGIKGENPENTMSRLWSLARILDHKSYDAMVLVRRDDALPLYGTGPRDAYIFETVPIIDHRSYDNHFGGLVLSDIARDLISNDTAFLDGVRPLLTRRRAEETSSEEDLPGSFECSDDESDEDDCPGLWHSTISDSHFGPD